MTTPALFRRLDRAKMMAIWARVGILLTLSSLNAYAESYGSLQNKTRIKQLETKISSLRLSLSGAENKKAELHQKLAETEKKISVNVQQLHNIQLEAENKQQQIVVIQKKIAALHEKLHHQQILLAKQVRGRYMLDESQPIKWLLNQENSQSNRRLLNFYQYVLQSRQQMIRQIQITEKKLALSEAELNLKYDEAKKFQEQLSDHQKKLEQDKNASHLIIQSLHQDIQDNQQALAESLKNRNNLSKLVSTLVPKFFVKNQNPLLYKNKKLQRPVAFKDHNIKRQNQGVVFFVNEGAPVTAVYPGKVVFSDWLKGYGLLLIIDHGQGFMTLYAHNQSLLKQKGDAVSQGIQIATVGHTGGLKQNGLYFEIRQYGKAIPPLKWLGS